MSYANTCFFSHGTAISFIPSLDQAQHHVCVTPLHSTIVLVSVVIHIYTETQPPYAAFVGHTIARQSWHKTVCARMFGICGVHPRAHAHFLDMRRAPARTRARTRPQRICGICHMRWDMRRICGICHMPRLLLNPIVAEPHCCRLLGTCVRVCGCVCVTTCSTHRSHLEYTIKVSASKFNAKSPSRRCANIFANKQNTREPPHSRTKHAKSLQATHPARRIALKSPARTFFAQPMLCGLERRCL